MVSGAIGFAHGGADFHRDLRELALFGHLYPPLETDAILYSVWDCASHLSRHSCGAEASLKRPRPTPQSSITASASISTNISGEISLLTSTMLVAGRITPKNSP